MQSTEETSRKIENRSWFREIRDVLPLIWKHSRIYLCKLAFLMLFSLLTVYKLSKDHYGLIVSTFTFTLLLFFDQILTKEIDDSFDFPGMKACCNGFKVVLFLVNLALFASIIFVDEIEANFSFENCQICAFALAFLSCFSAFAEAIANIPKQSWPSQQRKKGKNPDKGKED